MSCVHAYNPQLQRLANAIAQRVGQQRFNVWFNNSTRLELKQDVLEISVPNDFISELIGRRFGKPIQESAQEVLGHSLVVRFTVVPHLFIAAHDQEDETTAVAATTKVARRELVGAAAGSGRDTSAGFTALDLPEVHQSLPDEDTDESAEVSSSHSTQTRPIGPMRHPKLTSLPVRTLPAKPQLVPQPVMRQSSSLGRTDQRPCLRHDLDTFVVGPSNQLAFSTASAVAEFPAAQYNPLFIHGDCGLGKTHLLQGLCRRFMQHHPLKRWCYMTGEEFTNEFLTALRSNKLDAFRRRMRDLDLLVIDDVHFLGGKKATQEEFLHTFNAIEAMGRQVVMASDSHPKMIEEFGESLINRFVSGLVVRIDPPNFATRCEILRTLALRDGLVLSEDVTQWIARRVTQNVRELEGAITRITAHAKFMGTTPDIEVARAALGDLDRQMITPVRPDHVLQIVCNYFGLEFKDLMSGRRQRTLSLARSVAMYLIRKTAKLSFPEIGAKMGKRNHSTVISACRRIERAIGRNEKLGWNTSVGPREEEATELLQRLEEHSRAAS